MELEKHFFTQLAVVTCEERETRSWIEDKPRETLENRKENIITVIVTSSNFPFLARIPMRARTKTLPQK